MKEICYNIRRARGAIDKSTEKKSVRIQSARKDVCAACASESVVAEAADHRVGTGPAVERVVAGEAHENVCRRRSGQSIIEGRAREVLKSGQRVGAGAARVLGSRNRQADRYRSSRVFVRHGVGACSTIKNVVGAIAFERVVETRTRQILNIDQRVALGIAATRRSRRQAHRYP